MVWVSCGLGLGLGLQVGLELGLELGPCLGLVSGVKLVFDLDVKLLCVRVKVMCRVGPGLDYGCG